MAFFSLSLSFLPFYLLTPTTVSDLVVSVDLFPFISLPFFLFVNACFFFFYSVQSALLSCLPKWCLELTLELGLCCLPVNTSLFPSLSLPVLCFFFLLNACCTPVLCLHFFHPKVVDIWRIRKAFQQRLNTRTWLNKKMGFTARIFK